MNKSESIIELSKALSKFQSEVVQPAKDGRNPHFKSDFVTLDGVVKAITDTAPKYGLSFLQFPLNEDDKVGVKTLLLHDSGEFIEGDPIYTKPMKNDPQALGAVLTYLRRYSLSAIFGITSETDDDAEKSMDRSNQSQQQSKQSYSNTSKTNSLEEAASMIMKGGKHAGKSLKEIFQQDKQYLNWMLQNDKTDMNIKKAINMLLQAVSNKGVN